MSKPKLVPAEASVPKISLNVHEAAAATGVSVSTIQRAKRAGKLKAVKTAQRGGRELYLPADLAKWVSSLEQA